MSDLISRQAAIEALAELQGKASTKAELKGISKVWKRIKKLPSAQPEIVKCKDCKWKQGSECVRFADVRPFPDDYCSRAERKEA